MTEFLSGSPLVRALGLALLQFLWQGALIGAATALLLAVLRRSTAQARYVVACAGLAVMVAVPIGTAVGYMRDLPAVISAGSTVSFPAATGDVATPGALASSGATARLTVLERVEEWLPLVVLTWCAGVLALALHLFRGWLRLRRIRRGALRLNNGPRVMMLRSISARLGVTRPVRLAESALLEVPAVIGWLRPLVLVPTSALAGLSPESLEAILAHELAHVRRGDYIVNVIQCVVEVLLFYHPAVWWVSNQIRVERENCCDDVAASLSPDRIAYARALASLEELRATPRLAMAADGANLLHRIRRLVEPGSTSGSRKSGGFMTGVMLTIVLLAVGALSQAISGPAVSVADLLAASPVVTVAAIPAPRLATQPQSTQVAPPRDPLPKPAAQITGEVRDPSGGLLPGVTITVTSIDTAAFWTAITNARGQFHFGSLPDGAYQLTAQLAGFKTFKTAVRVSAGDNLSAGIRMRLGSLSESVEVVVPRSSVATSTPAPAASAATAASPASPAPPVPDDQLTPIPAPAPGEPVRIGGGLREPKKTFNVTPVYPANAVIQVSGYVIIDAIIGKDGAVQDARVVKSHPLLNDAALEAVRQWIYTPTLLNGVPIEVTMTATIIFSVR